MESHGAENRGHRLGESAACYMIFETFQKLMQNRSEKGLEPFRKGSLKRRSKLFRIKKHKTFIQVPWTA